MRADRPAAVRPRPTARLSFGRYRSPVGVLGVLAGPAGLRAVDWGLGQGAAAGEPDESVQQVLTQLAEYFAGQRRRFDLALDLPPMPSHTHAVLDAMASIEYGETVTYGELARRSGTDLPPRAVGSIMGTNPVPLVIPCHRVVASLGLGGFSGGDPGHELATKRWLLELEGALPPTLL